jgi:hypothetical protein
MPSNSAKEANASPDKPRQVELKNQGDQPGQRRLSKLIAPGSPASSKTPAPPQYADVRLSKPFLLFLKNSQKPPRTRCCPGCPACPSHSTIKYFPTPSTSPPPSCLGCSACPSHPPTPLVRAVQAVQLVQAISLERSYNTASQRNTFQCCLVTRLLSCRGGGGSGIGV